jgi:thiamine biosynthesis protein ThiI
VTSSSASPLSAGDVPASDAIVLRISEIFLKGKNRGKFFSAMIRHARRVLADLEQVTLEPMYLRAVVRHPPALREQVLERLGRVFGVSSMALGTTVPADLDAVTEAAHAFLAATPPGTSFKVESKRRDKSFPVRSDEISREVGGRLFERAQRPVDVHTPGLTIHVEIGRADLGEPSFVFGRVVPGPGGLPLNTAGSVGLLLSGGIDSPVAGWSAMRRGCRVVAVYFHSFPYTGDKTREKVLDLARLLAAWQGAVPVYVVHFTEVQKALRAHARAELAVLLYRRMMMRVASRLAAREGLLALVTGENLGQVASQTLENLGVIEDAASLPVLRPLLTLDKSEIVAQAQRIGTYATSIQPYEDCCSLFVPKHPVTRGRVSDLVQAERGLDVDAMADALARDAELVVVHG